MPLTTVTTAGVYNVQTTDYLIWCNAAGIGGTPITITLPSAATNTGRSFAVKQVSPAGSGSNDQCKVTPVATTAGTTTVTLDPPNINATNIHSSITLVSDGTKWWVISAGQ